MGVAAFKRSKLCLKANEGGGGGSISKVCYKFFFFFVLFISL